MVVGFGHGSGFAVAPNRVVTNYHVVELATRYPGSVVIGVVPSEGDKSYQGKLIAVDEERDLALIEFTGVRLPPLTFYKGQVQEGNSLTISSIVLSIPMTKLITGMRLPLIVLRLAKRSTPIMFSSTVSPPS